MLARLTSRKSTKHVEKKPEKPEKPEEEEIKPPEAPAKIWFEKCDIEDFEIGQMVGAGNFGHVYVAKHKRTNTPCAIKALSKANILKSKQLSHLRSEREILEKVDFPFTVNMIGYCQDEKCVYLILEYVSGGDFFTQLRNKNKLDEPTARFYAAQVLVTFEYLHGQDIIYRDLKPENILLDEKGNIKITDFGFAKKIEHRTFTLCGTPDYLAPEIILAKGHGKAVDWWTFGVLIYEMLAGEAPFAEEDASATYQRIVDGRFTCPKHFSKNARDLVRKLLTADLTKRIGCLKDGINEIKQHPWFQPVKWNVVAKKVDPPPLRPKPLASPTDTTNFEDYTNAQPMDHPFELADEDQTLFEDW